MIFLKKLMKKKDDWQLIEASQGEVSYISDVVEINVPVKLDVYNNAIRVLYGQRNLVLSKRDRSIEINEEEK